MAKYCVGKKNKKLTFVLPLFPFFLIFPSLTQVIQMGNLRQNLTGNTVPRILKFDLNVGYVFLYCVKENQPHPICHCVCLSILLSLQSHFLSQISRLL